MSVAETWADRDEAWPLQPLRFGPTNARLRQQIQEADAETLLEWSERILTAETPEAVFH